MAERDRTEPAQIKIRLRQSLRTRLEDEAKNNGYPLSTEIVRRLEESVRGDDIGHLVFGSAERFGVLATIDRLCLAIQLTTGKGWADRDTRYLMADTVASYIKHGAEIYATLMAGEAPSPTAARTVADAMALQAVAKILHDHLERQTKDPEENVD